MEERGEGRINIGKDEKGRDGKESKEMMLKNRREKSRIEGRENGRGKSIRSSIFLSYSFKAARVDVDDDDDSSSLSVLSLGEA